MLDESSRMKYKFGLTTDAARKRSGAAAIPDAAAGAAFAGGVAGIDVCDCATVVDATNKASAMAPATE